MYRTDFWTLWEKARVQCFKRTASKHVYYLGWNRSPAQVGCMRQVLRPGTLGRPRGIGWRRRWEGGLGWGTHVNPWLIHVNVWQNPLQYCKVISLQLIKKLKLKKNKIEIKKKEFTKFFCIRCFIGTSQQYCHLSGNPGCPSAGKAVKGGESSGFTQVWQSWDTIPGLFTQIWHCFPLWNTCLYIIRISQSDAVKIFQVECSQFIGGRPEIHLVQNILVFYAQYFVLWEFQL